MKLILGSLLILFFVLIIIPPVFGLSYMKPGNNSLENTTLHGQSEAIILDIEFGQDKLQPLLSYTVVHPQIENISLLFYGDEITLSEPELQVVGDGRIFRISSIPDGVLMFGYQDRELKNYKINVMFTTDKGFITFTVYTDIP